ncbi:MAG: PorV/PorQ family protein [Salinivirgaceae bacterium]|jgi:hypothetical protein|nr:PorV/PorQ family protein [Salinivirgaceae bacterium]
MLKNTFITLSLLILSAFAMGQSAPKYSNEFLSIGIGARALGMGNAVVASTNDVYATYWNPASLLNSENDVQAGYMHSEYFAGIGKHDYGAVSYKIDDRQSIGLSMVRFGIDNIPNTLELIDAEGNIRYDRVTNFSVADYAFLLSYARDFGIEGLQVGGNVKIIRRITGDFADAWGFGLDVGATYDYKGWKLAALARDVTSTFNAWSFNQDELARAFELTGNTLPENSLEVTLPKFILAVSKSFSIKEKFNLVAEANVDLTTDGKRNVLVKTDFVSMDPHVGLELNYSKIFFVRGGFINLQKEKKDDSDKDVFTLQPTIGAGLQIKQLSVDYAYTNLGGVSQVLYSHIVSLKYGFDL